MDVAFTDLVLNFTAALALPLALVASNPFARSSGPIDLPKAEPEKTEVAIREVKPKETRLQCVGCSPNEQATVDFFYDRGIKDRHAIATVLGNIKQESMFVPNVCEGGHRTAYHHCGRGYGLIQWTSANRYYGLGSFAKRYGGDPSSLHTQLNYLVNEVQWQRVESTFKREGLSIGHYMNAAYSWIGWGIHGARTHYAWSYANKLKYVEV